MKIFYWDAGDFLSRIRALLIISLVFSLFSFISGKGYPRMLVGRFNKKSLRFRALILFIILQLIFTSAAAVIVHKGVELAGDEPHYLAIAQSIAKDGDLNVFNQYAREEYREFIQYRLAHHSKVGKGFKKWYSFHLPGLSFTLAPFFLFKIPVPLLYLLVRIFLGIFGSLLGVLVYIISIKLWRNEKLSLFIFSVFMLTAPVFFYSIHIFSELQVLLLILLSLWFTLIKDNIGRKDILLGGFFIGVTVFWGMKYLIFIGVFSFLFLIYKMTRKNTTEGLVFMVFPFVFISLFLVYLYTAYGNFSPMSVYTGVLTEAQKVEYTEGLESIALQNRFETLFDYFFDQRDGLLLYNPFYLFFFPGVILAFKKLRSYYPHIAVSSASFIYLLYHGYSTVRPGYCPQARYLLPVVWTLMLFAVIYYMESRNRFMKKIFLLLPLYSILITVCQIFNPFTLYQSTTHNYLDRSGLLFQKLSNIHIDVSAILPSFIKVEGNFKYPPNIVFLLIVVFFIVFALMKVDFNKIGFFKLPVFIILFTLFSLFPGIHLYNPLKVNSSGGVSYLVHGNPYPRSDISDHYEFQIRNRSEGILTVSTVKKLGSIGLTFSGQRVGEKITVRNFNSRSLFRADQNGGFSGKIENPEFRTKGGRFFYTLRFDPDSGFFRDTRIRIDPVR